MTPRRETESRKDDALFTSTLTPLENSRAARAPWSHLATLMAAR